MDTNLPFIPGVNPVDIHVYFTADTAAQAAAVKARLRARFDWLKEGRWNGHASRISPHPQPMFELLFGDPQNVAKVHEVAEWLDKNRDGLSVLIHPNTTDGNVQDHTTHALWLGQPVAVRTWVFHVPKLIRMSILGLAGATVFARSYL